MAIRTVEVARYRYRIEINLAPAFHHSLANSEAIV